MRFGSYGRYAEVLILKNYILRLTWIGIEMHEVLGEVNAYPIATCFDQSGNDLV